MWNCWILIQSLNIKHTEMLRQWWHVWVKFNDDFEIFLDVETSVLIDFYRLSAFFWNTWLFEHADMSFWQIFILFSATAT